MSRPMRDDLIGKPFEAVIGEPWDFQSTAGQNRLTGAVLAASDISSSVEWLLLEVRQFQYEGNEITQVVGVNRYISGQDVFGELLAGNASTLNFMFALDGHELTADTVLTELAEKSKFGFLVGSVTKVG
jgi:hypothetical protein